MSSSDPIDRLAPTRRPRQSPAGYQSWENLAFLHWRVAADRLATLLPSGLAVDTFGGTAWVGLVPFHMRGVRPWWSPAVPGISTFHETNVRTYVHRDGVPGVWFFSLDAANRLAVWIARSRWRLNYFHARMDVRPLACGDHQGMAYHSVRAGEGNDAAGTGRGMGAGLPGVGIEVEIECDPTIRLAGVDESGHAIPETLEHFLVERYVLFAGDPRRPGSGLLSGRVHHQPYPLRGATVRRCEESLLRAAGIEVQGPPDHVVFSEGVDVEVFNLEPA